MRISSVLVFFGTYALFLVSGLLFRLDGDWYASLQKPSWTPPGGAIGLVWAVLFFCIALSLALLDHRVGIVHIGWGLFAAIIVNYVANQAFSFFSFTRQDWLAAGIDAAVVAVSAIVVAVLAWRASKTASLLFVPYAAWSAFATYLSFTIWNLNR